MLLLLGPHLHYDNILSMNVLDLWIMTSSNPISNIYKFVGTNFVLNLNIIIGFGDFWEKNLLCRNQVTTSYYFH